jgi:hypothetical protein
MAKSWLIGVCVVVLVSGVLAAQPAWPAFAAFNDSDNDGAIDVAERIGGSDPNDADSFPESAGGSIYLALPLCTDGVDNDMDGMTDDDDPGCIDTDQDLVDDPVEDALGSDPNDFDSIPEDSMVDAVLASLGFITFLCSDHLDNDLDGVIDSDDPGCAPLDTDDDGFGDVIEKTHGSDPDSTSSQPEVETVDASLCADGTDNDLDGLIDGDDPGCTAQPTETAAAPAEPTARPAEAATPKPTAVLPATGSGADGGRAAMGRMPLVWLAAAGVMLAGIGASWRRLRRRSWHPTSRS